MKILNFLTIVAVFALSACTQPQKGSADTLYPQKIGDAKFEARLAITNAEKGKGLMGIKSMPENEGMLFIYDMPTKMSFWMKNTKIPLDIAFIKANGEISQIAQMYPYNENSVHSASSEIIYALEMNQGWFQKNKINAGDKLDMKLFLAALNKRGQKQ